MYHEENGGEEEPMIYYCDTLHQVDFSHFLRFLPPDRRQKAERYRNPGDQNNCVATYLLLALALYQEYRILLPKNEPFSYTQTGKPYWKFTSACFSLSHCQKGAACSLSDQTEGETGIDIQEPRPVSPAVLRRVCSQKEQAEIALSSNPQAAFTRLWTLKESYVKQTGKGISGDLSQLDFSESGHLFHRYEKDFYQMSHPDFSLALCQKKIDTQPTPIAVHAKEILAFAESKYSD